MFARRQVVLIRAVLGLHVPGKAGGQCFGGAARNRQLVQVAQKVEGDMLADANVGAGARAEKLGALTSQPALLSSRA